MLREASLGTLQAESTHFATFSSLSVGAELVTKYVDPKSQIFFIDYVQSLILRGTWEDRHLTLEVAGVNTDI